MIDEKDLKIESYSSGMGALSNVRVTHIPSGMVEVSDESRSQVANKWACIDRLEERLAKREPYIGDPGDETDHDRWESEGGA
jgi:protein subunit release factor A